MFNTMRNMARALKETYKIAHDLRIQEQIEKLNSKIIELDDKKYYNHTSTPQVFSEKDNVVIGDSNGKIYNEVKTQKLQSSVSAFISKTETNKNRLAIMNMAKKQGLKVVITPTKGKDNLVHQAPKENADKFNEFIGNNKAKLEAYGIHFEPYVRKYNKGGKSL